MKYSTQPTLCLYLIITLPPFLVTAILNFYRNVIDLLSFFFRQFFTDT